jgi:hypothetical protein
MAQICFDTSTFYTVMIVGCSIIAYVVISIYKDKLEETKALFGIDDSVSTPQEQQQPQSPPTDNGFARSVFAAQVQRLEDMQRMQHPLTPPVRRGPFSYTGTGPSVPVTIPTRGEYGGFQQMGFLHNTNNEDQAMPLVGRRIHSNQYEYYTFHHNNPQIKIPIKLPGSTEINDGDSITVNGYAATLQAKIYELDAPRYIPY